ncbi:TetR/AcrR family transcriptional regulator [Saccharomonospora viridis]|jgi:AcrR family transcriptional regulator|uniref:Transcriptional regulator n=2 Tax=Saccharomonospora viridis TaxID=1852 RepID=C7MXJ7_SACVD|nr:TetR family transcriptional regulator [Saccharomonospora viridis]ACU97276.1 transcriptional regulator [Saccharomonospora viridis DSM 43017]KHF43543.1 TetR family transcriptional regulator [Saccharomonospora viridis]SFO77401.1 transcriptional regulator, TetR family [Saccharomonospora viridis]
MAGTDRTWAGTTLSDRRATRRRQLLEAGLELLGTSGPSAVSVRAVCRQAKLTERYFYENFTGRDEFVVAVYEHVAALAHQVLVDAVELAGPEIRDRAEAAVSVFVTLILDDPRKGRVLLLSPLADPALLRLGAQRLPMFAELVREQLSDRVDEQDRAMTATALVGGLANVFIAYLNGTLDVSRDHLTAHCVRLVLGADALHS